MSSKSSQPQEYEVTGPSEVVGTALLKIYNATASAYSAKGREERRKVARWNRSIQAMTSIEDRAAFMGQMGEVMISELAASPAPSITAEGPDPLRYDLRNLNDRRRDAILTYMERTGKATITTQEARHVLQTAENRALDRKAIWRALRAARDHLGASLDLLGGVLRLIAPSRPRHVAAVVGGGEGEGGVHRPDSPRPRRWAVPWDGED